MKPANEFRLYPWEFRGSGVDPTPHGEARLDFGAGERDYWLKVRVGRVFCREVNRVNGPIFSPLARAARGIEKNPVELARWTSAKIKRRDWGRLVVIKRKLIHPGSSSNNHTITCVVIGRNGRALASEWCGQRWFSFRMPKSKPRGHSGADVPPLWTPAWKPVGLHETINAQDESFLAQLIDETDIQSLPLTWVVGSHEQLTQLMTWLWVVTHNAESPRKPRYPSYWNGTVVAEGPQGPASISFDLDQKVPGIQQLADALLEKNLPAGFTWKPIQLPRIYWRTPVELAGERYCYMKAWTHVGARRPDVVSMNDRTESLLNLRDWLNENYEPERCKLGISLG